MAATQQFNLRWNNHTNNILQVLMEHLTAESLVDVTLSCEGKFVKAHRIILSACSSYFQEVFANNKDKNLLIILNGIKLDDLRSIIQFMYNGETRVHESRLQDLLAAAETLQVKGLSHVRTKYERGEITSIGPTAQQSPLASESKASEPDSSKESKTESAPVQTVKAALSLFGAPQAPTTSTAPTITGHLQPISAKAAARITSKATSKTISIAPRPSTATVPPLTIGTLMSSNVSPLSINNVRPVVPILPRPPSTKHAATPVLKLSSIVSSSSACKVSSAISTTSTAPSTSTSAGASLLCSSQSATKLCKNIAKSGKNPKTHLLVFNKDEKTAITEISFVPMKRASPPSIVGAITKSDQNKEEKKPEELPKIRKRRKMSHVVNELASETVFTCNGTVVLEPDATASKNTDKNPIAVRRDLCDGAEIEEITLDESNNVTLNIKSRQQQESLLIKKNEKRDPLKIPRPPNAFMIFAAEWRSKVAAENPTEMNTKISVRLGAMWKSLGLKAKEKYYSLANKANEEHKLKYPGYFYSPRQARMRKNSKHDRIETRSWSMRAEDFEEFEMTETYVEEDERASNLEAYSSESDDYTYVDEEEYMDEEDDDVILEYSAEEDEIDVKPELSLLEAALTQTT